jgi:hypothetical protein
MNLTPEVATTYRQPEPPVTTLPLKPEPRPVEQPPVYVAPEVSFVDVDWAAVALGLLALIMVGGLVPFWIYIFFLYNPR